MSMQSLNRIYLSIGIATITVLNACSPAADLSKERLVWQENFSSGNTINSAYWSKIPRGRSDWDRHMSDDPSLYEVKDGKLILRGTVNSDRSKDTARYITGGVFTKDKLYYGFGRWEVRAKLNGAQGAWPAFWLLPQGGNWPDDGEIDIMERLNFDPIAYQTVHSHYTHTLNIKDHPKTSATGKINPDDFNTYAVELHPDSLVFFINDIKTFTYPRIETDKPGQFPFNKHKYYLLLDMQLGGSWVGAVKPEDLPVEMEIDWVRFYEFENRK